MTSPSSFPLASSWSMYLRMSPLHSFLAILSRLISSYLLPSFYCLQSSQLKCNMKCHTILAGLFGLACASLTDQEIARDGHGLLSERQAYPYPATTIDMPVCLQFCRSFASSNFCKQINHFPHSDRYAPHVKGTFKQRYFFDSTYYKPGGPVYLYISGETSGTNRFSNLKTGSK
jgi:hypothetical protein